MIQFISKKKNLNNSKIKLFSNIKEMQQSSENQNGDIAVIYDNTTSNAKIDSNFQFVTFQEQVILPTAVTDMMDFVYETHITNSDIATSFGGSLSPNQFYCYLRDDSESVSEDLVSVYYESTDGINYIRTELSFNSDSSNNNKEDFINENTVDLKNMFHFKMVFEEYLLWNPLFGYFLQINSNPIKGVYRYINNKFVYLRKWKRIYDEKSTRLFEKVEEMEQSTENEIGELATTLEPVLSNTTETSQLQNIVFPQKVILPKSVVESSYLYYNDENYYIEGIVTLNPNSFTATFSGSIPEISVEYTSEDGITYNRTSSLNGINVEDDTIYLPVPINYIPVEDEPPFTAYDELVGYFMQLKSFEFKGIYKFEDDGWKKIIAESNATK